MFDVTTDHQIIAFGADAMGLYSTGQLGDPIVTAQRANGTWTVHAAGVDDATTEDRAAAIGIMQEHAFAALGPSGPNGRGYSVTIPHGLEAQP